MGGVGCFWIDCILLAEFFLHVVQVSVKHFFQSGFSEGQCAFLFTFVSLLILMLDGFVLPNYDYESIYWIILAVGTICLTKATQAYPELADV